jgi:hypothetical protein
MSFTPDNLFGPGALPLQELNRWWEDLYPLRRRFYTFTFSMTEIESFPNLGGVITLQSDRFKLLETPKPLVIRRMKYNYSNATITIEGWG